MLAPGSDFPFFPPPVFSWSYPHSRLVFLAGWCLAEPLFFVLLPFISAGLLFSSSSFQDLSFPDDYSSIRSAFHYAPPFLPPVPLFFKGLSSAFKVPTAYDPSGASPDFPHCSLDGFFPFSLFFSPLMLPQLSHPPFTSPLGEGNIPRSNRRHDFSPDNLLSTKVSFLSGVPFFPHTNASEDMGSFCFQIFSSYLILPPVVVFYLILIRFFKGTVSSFFYFGAISLFLNPPTPIGGDLCFSCTPSRTSYPLLFPRCYSLSPQRAVF